MNSLLVWSLLVVSMYLPVAEASAVYAAVELAQLPVSLGQEKVDLSGTTYYFSFSLQRKPLRNAELFQQRPAPLSPGQS